MIILLFFPTPEKHSHVYQLKHLQDINFKQLNFSLSEEKSLIKNVFYTME